MSQERKLYPEDRARVDSVLNSGCNDVERKPFRPLYMIMLVGIVFFALLGLSMLIVHSVGI